jgi:hypothetical protein
MVEVRCWKREYGWMGLGLAATYSSHAHHFALPVAMISWGPCQFRYLWACAPCFSKADFGLFSKVSAGFLFLGGLELVHGRLGLRFPCSIMC